MDKPRIYKTEAIVIKRANLGEADKILTIYTPGLGKIRAVAKGVRRPKSKLGGHVETLTRSSMMLARGRNLDIVTQSQTLESFLPLRGDLLRMSCAIYAAEVIDRFTEEHIGNYPAYRLLHSTMVRLMNTDNIELVLRYFEIRMLGYLGYKPQLQTCISCREPIEPRDNYFSASGGGILCPGCRNTELRVRPISLNALKLMRLFQGNSYDTAGRVQLNAGLAKELEIVIREYIRYILEREVKSAEFLDRLKRT